MSTKPFLGLLAMVRNECEGYPEWFAHHRSQGFDTFYLIDNNSTDDCRRYLRLQPDVKVLHWFPRAVHQFKQLNRTESNQAPLCTACVPWMTDDCCTTRALLS